jgi:hypothetical protein
MKTITIKMFVMMVAVGVGTSALGQTVTVPNITFDLSSNLGSYTIPITVSTPPISGVDFNFQIGDNTGAGNAPTITNVDIVSDSSLIFSTNNIGQTGDGRRTPWLWIATTTTVSGNVEGTSRLALVTLDTSHMTTAGSWDLLVTDTVNGSTALLLDSGVELPATFTNGRITAAVPEPGTIAGLGSGMLCVLALVGVRRWRAKAAAKRSAGQPSKAAAEQAKCS